MIRIDNLNFSYGQHAILKDINLTLPAQQLCAIIGPNGAGKSTLLSLIARLEKLQQGRILIDELDIRHTASNKLAQKIAILQQQTQFLSRLTIDDLLLFARYPYHKGNPQAQDYAAVTQMIDYFQLQQHRHRFIDQLSGGQRQLALVAMVFTQNTDIILLDEPLNNLDVYHARQLMQILRTAVDDWGKTVVLVLHDINYATHYADHITAMRRGQVFISGRMQDVITAHNMRNLYQVEIDIITHHNKPLCVHF